MHNLALKLREGAALHQRGDLPGAESCFREVLDAEPEQIDALNFLGMVLALQKRYGEAVKAMQKAITVKPGDPVLLGNLGGLLNEANDPLTAIGYLREAIRLKPDHTDAIVSLAAALQAAGRIDEAERQFEKALKLTPTHPRALFGTASLAQNSGNTKLAIEKFRILRKYYPKELSPLIQILLTDKVTLETPELKQAEIRAREPLAARERRGLHCALAKAYDDLRRYDDAMAHLELAKAGADPFDMDSHRRNYDILGEVFSRDFIEERREWGLKSDRPVFVVGMPRSGTSLVEQIIASHPKAFGAGELDDLGFLAATLGLKGVRADGVADPQRIRAWTMPEISKAAETYLEGLTIRSPKSARIVDKMPHNYESLGLIAVMLPKARIIHCRRNPIDTCLSIYMQDYANLHPYSSDLRTVGDYYSLYAKLMDHWKNVLPLPFLEVDYERLVADPRPQVQRITNFLGLRWDEACLNFHRTRRNVSTSSHWQVRQPLYTSSVRRWQHYREHLEPLIERLGKHAAIDDVGSQEQKLDNTEVI